MSQAAGANPASLDTLLQMDLQQLMAIDVTLVSRSEEKQFATPAAVYVLTQEDIRRSGYRRLPEILRMVPGLHVAKLNANRWAVSSRNSLNRFSSTMLVMIDGRTVYTPFYAGVYWEMQDTFLEDIERIEVVRGPGGSLWGANAVDGIINIITRSAAATHGTKAYALAGSGEMELEAGLRHGGKAGNVNYRIFAKGYQTDTGEYLGTDLVSSTLNPSLYQPAVGQEANDDGEGRQAGFRLDWQAGPNRYMLQGSAQHAEFDDDRVLSGGGTPNELDSKDFNLVFNWERQLDNGASIGAALSYDALQRDDDILDNDERTFDFDAQYTLPRGAHLLSLGAGYRNYDNRAEIAEPASCGFATPCFAVDPESSNETTWSAFVQDRIALSDKLMLTVGSKVEHNDYTGFEFQPTLRAAWMPDDQTTWWAAVTRAVRVPDRVSADGMLDFGMFAVPIGDKNLESYYAYAYELGFRKRLSQTLVADLTAFYSDYRNTVQNSDVGTDDIYGFEGYLKYQPVERLRLELGYAYHAGQLDRTADNDQTLNDLPRHSVYSRMSWDPVDSVELDALVYYVDKLESLSGNADVPDYTRVDLRCGWRPTPKVDVSLLLTNLFDDVHPEAREALKINTGVERGAMVKVTFTTD